MRNNRFLTFILTLLVGFSYSLFFLFLITGKFLTLLLPSQWSGSKSNP